MNYMTEFTRRAVLRGVAGVAVAASLPVGAISAAREMTVVCAASHDGATYAVLDDQPQTLYRFDNLELRAGDKLLVAD
jgi:hypothetical protein